MPSMFWTFFRPCQVLDQEDITDHDISTNEASPDEPSTIVLQTEVKVSHLPGATYCRTRQTVRLAIRAWNRRKLVSFGTEKREYPHGTVISCD